MRVERNVLIPLRDGVEVAADLYRPDGDDPVPAVFSYYPYRKDDYIGAFAGSAIEYFAHHGYASLLVDFRGLGSSGGIAWDAMDAREADDGYDIVEWLGAQPWCDGGVGIWGISYGGIMSFKTAAKKPGHLKAMVPIMGSLDIYHDWFYPGGCFNAMGASTWAGSMVALQLMPPTLQDTDGRWYDVWLERIEKTEPYLLPWREHPARDEYWQSKTIDPAEIDIPTFLIGGWRDIFPELMVRAYEQIHAPKKLLMGPWLHTLPDLDETATTDYLAMMKRWWDRWLKGHERALDDEAPVTLYVQNADVWRDEQEWPPARTEQRALALRADRGLGGEAGAADSIEYTADPSVGTAAGLWDPMSLGIGAPIEQSADDARSIAFTGEPLPDDVEVTGSPEATLRLALEEGDDANLVVKLSEVSPDGYSTLITTGWLRATHVDSHEEPQPLAPRDTRDFDVQLWATSYRVPTGHRLRVSVSLSDFPRVWPTATNPRIRLEVGGDSPSSVTIPVVADAPDQVRDLPVPDPSVNPAPLVVDYVPVWSIERDLARNRASVTMGMSWISHLPTGGGKLELTQSSKASVAVERPDGAEIAEETTVSLEMPSGADVLIETRSWHTARSIAAWGRILVDGRPFFERQWRG